MYVPDPRCARVCVGTPSVGGSRVLCCHNQSKTSFYYLPRPYHDGPSPRRVKRSFTLHFIFDDSCRSPGPARAAAELILHTTPISLSIILRRDCRVHTTRYRRRWVHTHTHAVGSVPRVSRPRWNRVRESESYTPKKIIYSVPPCPVIARTESRRRAHAARAVHARSVWFTRRRL